MENSNVQQRFPVLCQNYKIESCRTCLACVLIWLGELVHKINTINTIQWSVCVCVCVCVCGGEIQYN